MTSNSNGGEAEDWDAESVCPTEDLAFDDNATQFSGKADDEGTVLEYSDLDAALQEYLDEQEKSSPSPTPGTSKETCEHKCQNWLDQAKIGQQTATEKPVESERSNGTGNGASSEALPLEAEIPIEKMAALLKDTLSGSRTYSTFGSDSQFDERKVPLSPISQIAADIPGNLPEALMSMICFMGTSDTDTTSAYSKQAKAFLSKVLELVATPMLGSGLGERKESDSSARVKGKYTEDNLNMYFGAFEIVTGSTRPNKHICKAVEHYVNKQIEASKAIKDPWIGISNLSLNAIISSTNEDKRICLCPEKVAKYVNRLQSYVWDNILNRCFALLKDWGFDLVPEPDDTTLECLSSQERSSQESQGSELELQCSQEGDGDALYVQENAAVQVDEIEEIRILQAVRQNEELQDSQSSESSNDTNYSDSDPEVLRDSQSSNGYSFPLSPSALEPSLPRYSPVFVKSPTPTRLAELTGYANDLRFRNFDNSSQESSSSEDSIGPFQKFRRLNPT